VSPLEAWHDFYVIVGSSAGGLTGLQFVVMALIADSPLKTNALTADAFSTPTIVHFGVVLLLSGILTAPWSGMAAPTALCGACGIIGVVYSIVVSRRLRRQDQYQPVFEDWLFHVLLPVAAYAILAASMYIGRSYIREALFGVATAALLLLFIGVHNAWDSVTYLVITGKQQPPADSRPPD
jgi:uncharacterized membrane protein HdeD (DUF308 family)